ncbi:Ras GTPase-activating-like protein rng2 isoform 2 [Hibiscus syriacus]|uniref:Ras GTPase-activating-like protein rng2 isoform 2 n=1 Tax=Hibiscus syriacus TaxID=106335 RepID=A0A6A3A164_HIBSY|nr:Ras GTPase-activating-like protein rng2 isoform 2 [Hibiscus syriacus]
MLVFVITISFSMWPSSSFTSNWVRLDRIPRRIVQRCVAHQFGHSLVRLVAIESGSQSLGRAYAVLLFCAILPDVSWFVLFAHDIWNMPKRARRWGREGKIAGCCSFSRLGVSYVSNGADIRDPDFDLRMDFLAPSTPSNALLRQCSQNESDEALGGAIYDPPYYSSLFEDRQLQNRNS